MENEELEARPLNEEEETILIRYLQKRRGLFNGLALYNEGYPWFITPQGFIFSEKVDLEFEMDFIANQI